VLLEMTQFFCVNNKKCVGDGHGADCSGSRGIGGGVLGHGDDDAVDGKATKVDLDVGVGFVGDGCGINCDVGDRGNQCQGSDVGVSRIRIGCDFGGLGDVDSSRVDGGSKTVLNDGKVLSRSMKKNRNRREKLKELKKKK